MDFVGAGEGRLKVAPSLIEAGISTGRLEGHGGERDGLAKQGGGDWLESTREGVDASQAMDEVDRSTTSLDGTCIRAHQPGLRGVPARGNGHRWGLTRRYHDSGRTVHSNDDQPSGFNFQLAVFRQH